MEQFFTFLGNHPLLVGTFVLLVVLFFRNESARAGATVGTQELVRLVNKENAIVLDVRDRTEFMEGHIVDAVNIPYASLEARVDELSKHKETGSDCLQDGPALRRGRNLAAKKWLYQRDSSDRRVR